MNIVKFKMQLVEDLVGKSLESMETVCASTQHTPVRIQEGARWRCAYCAMRNRGYRRTRYQCAACGIALCVIGSSPREDEEDCFTIAHENEERRKMVLEKHLEIQQRNNKKSNNKNRFLYTELKEL